MSPSRMRRAVLTLTVAMAAVLSRAAGNPPAPTFRLVDRNEQSLNAAAADGYRIVTRTTCRLMQRIAIPPDIYRYRVLRLELRSHPSHAEHELNAAGAHGYRLIAESVGFVPASFKEEMIAAAQLAVPKDVTEVILEKEPHPTNYRYRVIEDLGGLMWPLKRHAANPGPGFRLVALEINRGTPLLIYEKPLEEHVGEKNQVDSIAGGYEILGTFRTSALEKDLNKTAAVGYRFLNSPFWSTVGGGISALMVPAPGGGKYAYLTLPYKKEEEMLRRMKEAAERGYVLHPRSLLSVKAAVLEKAPGVRRVDLQLLDLKDPAVLTTLADRIARGYGIVELWQGYVVLEKGEWDNTPDATSQQPPGPSKQ